MQLLLPFYLVLSVITVILYTQNNDVDRYKQGVKNLFSFILLLFFVIIVGSRSFDHPGDTGNYLQLFRTLGNTDLFVTINEFRIEKGFLLLTSILGELIFDERFFLLSVAILQAILWYICFYKWVESRNVLLSILIFISLFASYNLGLNVLRQGIAIPLSFIGLKFLFDRKVTAGFIIILLAALFHKSVLLMLVGWLLTIDRINVKYYFILLFVCTLLSILGVFSGLVDFIRSNVDSYRHLVGDYALERYNVGFRLDFWLFSIFPILLYYVVKDTEKYKYFKIVKFYSLIFSVFVIMFAIPYSDRVGLYTWLMFPILLTLFIGDYKIQILNLRPLIAIITAVIGIFFFSFYSVMDTGRYFNDIL